MHVVWTFSYLVASDQESLALLCLWTVCVSWRQRQWQCCSLHSSDSIDVLLAVRPLTLADITVSAIEGS